MASNGKVFLALLAFLKRRGYADDLIRASKRITDISEYEKIGESIIELEFDDEKLMEYLGLSEDDIFYYNRVHSYYPDMEIVDYYTVKENFLEGHSFEFMYDEENYKLLGDISKLLLGKQIDFNDSSEVSELNQKMFELFEHECNDIIYEYQSEMNHAIVNKLREVMDKEVGEVINSYDFDIIDLEKIKIRAADLFSYYLEYNAPHLNISQLFERILSKHQIEGGWYEYAYEYESSAEFDKEGFNNYVQRKLGNILDKISSDLDDEDKKKYYQFIETTSKKFPTNREIPVPKTKKYNFIILGFEKEGPKIVIKLINNENRKTKIITLTEENFNHLLYQPTLFDFDDI